MRFIISSAVIKTTSPTAKTNPNTEYILATAKMYTPVPFGAQRHQITMFMDPEEIEIWRELIEKADGKPLNIDYPAEYVIVDNLPSFKATDRDGRPIGDVRNSLRLLCRVDPDTGKVFEDPHPIAMRIIDEIMYKVTVNPAPITVTNVAGAAPEKSAEEKLAELQKQLDAMNG